jgi:choline dehydrogenase-like flavoprotein
MGDERTDVVIVGSGATGSWAAYELTRRGVGVMLLEAGGQLDYQRDVRAPPPAADGWQARRPVQSRYIGCHAGTQHLYVDDLDNPYTEAAPFDWIRSRQVGGRAVIWGRVALRMSDHDFKAADRDGWGESWPIGYRDLAPYYERVEELLGVCGSSEGIAHMPDGRFLPAKPMTRGEEIFKRSVEARWPGRRVIPNRGIDVVASPSGWPTFTPQGSTLAAAAATGRLTLRTGAIARQVVVDESTGSASGVLWLDRATGKEQLARARVVMLCASTVETTRLLFKSATPRQPDGLGNSSGVLGRYIMDHTLVRVAGVVPSLREPPTVDAGGPSGILMPAFRNVAAREPRFLRGYQVVGAVQRRGLPPLVPPDAEGARFILAANGEQLPRAENRITLDPTRKDAWGIPVARVECTLCDNDRALLADAVEALHEMADAAGFQVLHELTTPKPPGWMTHETGTARMGADRRTSVLDPFNRSWDVPNLFVTDGACFVSVGTQNTTLTLLAITARACDHIADEMMRRNL